MVGESFQISVKAQNNIGGIIKRTVLVAAVAEDGSVFNFFSRANFDKILSELGNGRKNYFFFKIKSIFVFRIDSIHSWRLNQYKIKRYIG